jgi:acetylornithine deacetylase/succinyl-diaminopimelate desuccinylase-like protein
VLDRALVIQQIPAPPFAEIQRAEFLRDQFLAEGLREVTMDNLGNVYGRLAGSGKTRPLVVSAHLDTVFPFGTDLQVQQEADRIYGPGIGDNSLALASLFGLLWALRQKCGEKACLPGDLWLVANVGEEGLGDLRGMRAVVDRFGDQVLAYLVLEGMSLGTIYHRGLGVRRFRITINTAGGHSWTDYGSPSAIHELAELITRLTALPIPSRPRSSLNVGVISGGTSVNTIAPEAHLELDLRSESTGGLQELTRKVESSTKAFERADVEIFLEIIGQRPAGKISRTHPLVKLAEKCLRAQHIDPELAIGSTDANLPLSRGLPAICVGISTGFGAHTQNECVNTQPLAQGLAQLVGIVEGIFEG